MKRFVLAALLLPGSLAIAQDPCHQKTTPECLKVQQERCRKAADMGLEQARALPAKGASETERKNEIVRKIEALVSDNRKKGVDECRTWTQIMGVAFNQ